MRARERVDRLQNRVQRLRAFRPVQEKRAFGGLDQLGLLGFEDARGARVLGFAKNPLTIILKLAGGREVRRTYTSRSILTW